MKKSFCDICGKDALTHFFKNISFQKRRIALYITPHDVKHSFETSREMDLCKKCLFELLETVKELKS